ncbi:MAG: hypothetical protein JWM80_429 [Cyanobacteria bacterium RYN_339]|nr:hypothetical protein [Cyanobacteria bacterium RYN_339]
MSNLAVTIAGLTVSVDLPSDAWLEPLQPRLRKFIAAPGASADLTVSLGLDPNVAAAPGGEPRVEAHPDGLHLRHDNFDAWLPPSGPGRLTIFQAETEPVDLTYTMVLDSFLRLAMVQLLEVHGGLMLHAAGIATGPDAGYVFFGPSGSGKTTVCRLSHPRYRILCDEIVAVRPGPDGERLYGTPFNGAWGDSLAEDVPLRELFYLRQAPANRRVPLDPLAAARAILESAVFYQRDPDLVGRFLDVALGLIHRVPVTQLEFIAKESLWETVLAPTR